MSNQDLNLFPHLKINVPSFLLKTYEILENDSLSDLISWNKEGTAFVVFNPSELSNKVLANYFKHKNYPSFLRQLNMYNFKKTRNQYGQSEFRHKWFRRGLKNMLQYIRRRNQEESELRIEAKDSSQELDNYKKEHENLKQIVRDLQECQIKLQKDLKLQLEQSASLNRQNHNTLQVYKTYDFQAINQVQLQFNQKYDYVTMMLTNSVQNLPQLVSNFKDSIKFCLDETTLKNIYPQLENNYNSQQYLQNNPYNQLQYMFQRQYYLYQNDQKQYLYKKNQQLALPLSTQSTYLSPNNFSFQNNSQSNSPYRGPSMPMSPYLLDSRSADQYSLYQQS